MSYCRFSSDNFKSDIYAYESCHGGFEIHVAGCRYEGEIPAVDYELVNHESKHKEFFKQRENQHNFLKTAKREDINLKYAGESFSVDSLQELKTKLIELKNLGYHIPKYTFEQIEWEIKEESLKQ